MPDKIKLKKDVLPLSKRMVIAERFADQVIDELAEYQGGITLAKNWTNEDFEKFQEERRRAADILRANISRHDHREIVDIFELALKAALPGFHVDITVRRFLK